MMINFHLLQVKGELYVIMEYCKYGSLDHYLAKRRITFINELLLIRSSQVPQSSNDGYLTPDSLAQSGKADVSCYQGELDPDWSRNLDSRRHSGSFLSTSDLLVSTKNIFY